MSKKTELIELYDQIELTNTHDRITHLSRLEQKWC